MPVEENEMIKGRPNYASTLCLCLLSSLGVCLAFLPYIPLSIDNKRDGIFTVSKIIMIFVILAVQVLLILFIRNKERFHQAQVIFWPNRCRHCAKILGNIRSTPQSPNSTENQEGDQVVGESTSDALPIPVRHEINPTRRSYSSVHSSGNNFNGTSYFLTSQDFSSTRRIQASPESPERSTQYSTSSSLRNPDAYPVTQGFIRSGHQCRRQRISKRHRSLVNVFYIFSLMALFGIPFLIIKKFTCIIVSDSSRTKLIVGEIYDILLLSLIPVSMMFATRYYDAVFVSTPMNCYSIVVFLSGGIWISAVKLVLPIANLLGFSEMSSFCHMNGTFGNVLDYGEKALTPFFTECAIIATGIIWQAWTSFVSRSELHLDREMPRYDTIPVASSRNFFQVSLTFLKSCFWRRHLSSRNSGEEVELIPKESRSEFERYIFRSWIVSFTISVIYFIVCMWLIWDGFSRFSSTNRQVYIGWSLEIVYCFPYYVFFYRISSLSGGRALRPKSSQLSLEGHDILLLLCTCGIFCQSIFRITSGFGLLLSQRAKSGDDLAAWIFSLIYSMFIIILIFNLTSFLVRIQRQDPSNPAQMKWVLTFLIYISLSYSTEWFIDSIINETWVVQCQFFGDTTGKVVGTLLDPFATLFGLHAAMVAHEAYKVTLKKALQQQRCTASASSTDRND